MDLGQRTRLDLSAQRFREESAQKSRLDKESHDQIIDGREQKYVSERTVPTEGKILGPSDSSLKNKRQETSE